MSIINHPPCISVILVTWNSALYLPRCLDCLARQTYKDFEVVLVDNGSTDGSLDRLESRWPELAFRIEKLKENRGFAFANNLGARLASGLWLALLNTDAFPESDWLEMLLQATERYPEFIFFASRQIQANMPQFLDGAGDAYHISGLAWRRFAGWPSAQFGLDPKEVFSPCAAAALYSRQVFLKVDGFDEDFFSYHEDVDLAFRLRLQGFRCLYIPEAIVEHIGSATLGDQSNFALYHWQRNFIWSYIQNMPSTLLWRTLPAHIMANIIYQVNYGLRGRGRILWNAKIDAFRGFPRALHKRQEIQKNRKVKNKELLRKMEGGWLQPYLLGYHIRKFRQTISSSK